MGQSTQDSHLSSSTMKMFVVLAFAAAEPEADPALFYSGLTHGYNSMYNTGVVSPYTYGSSLWRNAIPAVRNVVSTPVMSSYRSPLYHGYSAYSHLIHKREAEAEADPALFYSGLNSVYNTAAVSPYTYTSSLWRNAIPAVSNVVSAPLSHHTTFPVLPTPVHAETTLAWLFPANCS